MRIAVAYSEGNVYGHFGHALTFALYEIDGGNIISREIKSTDGKSHSDLIPLLLEWKTNVLFVGGIGSHAIDLLERKGIQVYTGVKGEVEKNVIDFLNGKLSYDPSMVHQCSHGH